MLLDQSLTLMGAEIFSPPLVNFQWTSGLEIQGSAKHIKNKSQFPAKQNKNQFRLRVKEVDTLVYLQIMKSVQQRDW